MIIIKNFFRILHLPTMAAPRGSQLNHLCVQICRTDDDNNVICYLHCLNYLHLHTKHCLILLWLAQWPKFDFIIIIMFYFIHEYGVCNQHIQILQMAQLADVFFFPTDTDTLMIMSLYLSLKDHSKQPGHLQSTADSCQVPLV